MASGSSLRDYLTRQREKDESWLHLIWTPDTRELVENTVEKCRALIDMRDWFWSGEKRVTFEIFEDYESFADDTMIPTLKKRVRKQHVYVVSDPHGDFNAKRNLTEKIMEITRVSREKRAELIGKLVGSAKTTNDKLIHDTMILDAVMWRGGAETWNLIQLAMPYARQDKVTKDKRQALSFDRIWKWFGQLLWNKWYAITLDLHNEASLTSLWQDQTSTVNLETWWFLEECLKHMWKERENTTLSGADQGWDTKIKGIAQESQLHNITVVKSRDYSARNTVNEDATTIVGDIEWRDILIHDDILDTGGTLCSLLKKMLEKNPKSINIAITHGMFHWPAYQRLQEIIDWSNGVIEKVFTTNSIHKENLPDYVEVIDTSNILANTILSIHLWQGVDRNDNTDYLESKAA